jgi:hypothetical protein
MSQDKKLATQRREWVGMRQLGQMRYVFLHVLAWTGAVTLMNGLLLLIAKLAWVHVWSELHWSDLKLKFQTPPPSEDWMAR